MSDHAAFAALSRLNFGVVAIAPQYTALANDLKMMATVDPEEAQRKFLASRADLCAAFGFRASEQNKPYAFAAGLAIIPVTGTLINRFGGAYSWITGYNAIRSLMNAALADDDVKGIVLDVNSFGGEAAGCFELSSEIRAAREKKPVMAMVDSNAYSAGYAIASAASKIIVIPSGGVGSIGVITMHIDWSKMLADAGINVTLIYESEHKADGNPYEPLPDSVKKDIQARLHTKYEAFVSLVAENRGTDAQKIRDTKSQCYSAEDALALGLIDAIGSPMQAAQAFLDGLTGSNINLRKEESMSTATNAPGADEQAAIQAKAVSDARTAERARMSGILNCDEAKGRAELANHLAMNTEMSVDAAKAILAAAPKAEAKAATPAANAFETAMNNGKNPNVGADGSGGADNAESPVNAILAAQALATGVKPVTQ